MHGIVRVCLCAFWVCQLVRSFAIIKMCVHCTVFRNETWKKCVDKWLMMDFLMNCCLFCSINFIIHCRWLDVFSSSSSSFPVYFVTPTKAHAIFFIWPNEEGVKGAFYETSNAFKSRLFFCSLVFLVLSVIINLYHLRWHEIRSMNRQICRWCGCCCCCCLDLMFS